MTEQQPPHDITAEQNVIGGLMLSEHVVPDVIDVLSADAKRFYRPAHQIIYAAILDLHGRGQPTDATVVAAELTKRNELARVGGAPYLHTCLESVPIVGNAVSYAEIVAERAEDREWEQRGSRLIQAGRTGQRDVARDLIAEWADAGTAGPAPEWASRFVTGGGFILDAPALPAAVWGRDETIGWAEGESLLIGGPVGVGKTTLCVQLVLGRLGILKDVLGLPVQPGQRKVLYLAMDRPPQIGRAMARHFTEADRQVLDERLIVWKGPPPADLSRDTGLLSEMCRHADADTVVVDSLKDGVRKLSDDESGGGYNQARQRALVDGAQVLELHHQRKSNGDNKRPSKLDDVYGSVWLTAGAGSVVLLWGEAGDPVVELVHLKQPAEALGPWQITHDHTAGTSEITHQADLLTMARHQGRVGLTAKLAAESLFQTDKPTASQVEKARRKLDKYVTDGPMVRHGGQRGGGSDRAAAAYFLTAQEPS